MSRKNRKDDLDTETTFADMNVEGFKWYDPSLKKEGEQDIKKVRRKVSRKEYWQLVRGAFAAMLPFICILMLVMGILIAISYLWLH